MQLRNEKFSPNDGTRYQLREETNEKPKIEHVAQGFHFFAIDVDGVRHGLKGVERDAHRQQDLVHPECGSEMRIRPLAEGCMRLTPVRSEQRLHRIGDEVSILEVEQDAQVDGQTCG